MHSTTYAAIVFDLDNTLLDFDRCESDAINAGLIESNIHLDDRRLRDFRRWFERSNAQHWPRRREIGLHSVVAESYSYALKGIGIDIFNADNLANGYLSTFSENVSLEPYAADTIKALSRTVRLAVITNGVSPMQERRLAAAGLAPYFEHIVVSDAVGHAKPEPTIFRIVLERMQLSPPHVLYVGDSITYDYTGARASGIDFCWYNRNGEELRDGVHPQFVIDTLSELLDISA